MTTRQVIETEGGVFIREVNAAGNLVSEKFIKKAPSVPLFKFNENHDETGRFSSSEGGSSVGYPLHPTKDIKTQLEAKRATASALDRAAKPLENMSRGQQQSVERYSTFYYRDVNHYLKGDTTISTEEREDAETIVTNLDKLFEEAALKDSIKAYRGVSDVSMANNEDLIAAFNTPGSEVVLPGFVSTSASPSVASHFSYGKESRLLEIDLPKGTKALYIGKVSTAPRELELLVNRGTHFEVGETRMDVIEPGFGEDKHIFPEKIKITKLRAIL